MQSSCNTQNANLYLILTQVFETWDVKMESCDHLKQMRRIQIIAAALETTMTVFS